MCHGDVSSDTFYRCVRGTYQVTHFTGIDAEIAALGCKPGAAYVCQYVSNATVSIFPSA